MEYPVIIEQKNGVYRAVIPTLADLSAEGQSPDEAMEKVQQAAEAYLAAVEVRTIIIEDSASQATPRYSTARDWLDAVKVFEGDEEALEEHFGEIQAERQRQREEVREQDK
jgi:predicted RNase H-like HicB family nuclease